MEGFMRGVSNNLLLRHDRSNCTYQGESGTAQVAGRNYRFAHNLDALSEYPRNSKLSCSGLVTGYSSNRIRERYWAT